MSSKLNESNNQDNSEVDPLTQQITHQIAEKVFKNRKHDVSLSKHVPSYIAAGTAAAIGGLTLAKYLRKKKKDKDRE